MRVGTNLMRGRAAVLWALLALLGWAPVAWAGGGGENMLLIVNPEDENAVRIAQEYQRLRGIPDANIIFITPLKGFANMFTAVPTEAQWKSTYVDPILSTIQARGLSNQIDYIAELGQPYAYGPTPSYYGSDQRQSAGYGLANLYQFAAGFTSTNLVHDALPLYDVSGYTLGANDAISSTRIYTNWSGISANAQFFMGGQLGWSGFGGNSAAQIISNLQYTISGDGMKPVGTVYLETNSDIRTTTRMSQFPGVTNQLAARGITGIIEAGNTPVNRTNVLGTTVGYAGMVLPNGSTYLPGSWGDNLTSNGSQFDTMSQTKSTMFIASGAAGTSGTVTEPYADSARFPNAMIHVFSADGSTLGEAYYKASQSPDLLLFTGDMLAQPFADIPTVTFTSGPSDGGTVNGSVALGAQAVVTPSATTTGIKQLGLYVDGKLRSTITDSNGTFNLDTTTLSDGRHQLRVVGVNNSQAESEGYILQNIFVNNHGRSTDTPTNMFIQASQAALVSVNSVAGDGTVDHVELRQMGRTVGQVAGSSGSASISATNLAYGANTVVPVAVFTDGAEVAGAAFSITRQPNYLAGAGVTSLDDRTGGLLGRYFLGKGSNSIANSDFSGTADITRLQANSAIAAPTGLSGITNVSLPAYSFLATANITNLAYRMTGKFTANVTGEYSFFFHMSQDSVLVKVDGEAVLGFDNTSWGQTTMWGSNIFLSAGQHDVELLAANRETGTRNGYFDVALLYRGPDGIMRIFDSNSIYQPFYWTAPTAIWTGLGDGHLWSNPANWATNGLPRQNEMAVLDSVAEGTSRTVTFDAIRSPTNLMDSILLFQNASANATNALLVQGNLIVTNTIWLIASNGFTYLDTRGGSPSTTTVGKIRAVTFDSGRAGVTLGELATINAARFSLSNSFLTNLGVANFTSVYLEGGSLFDQRPGATLNAAGFTNVGGTFRIGGGMASITNSLLNAGGMMQFAVGTNLNRLVVNTGGAIWQSGGEMRALTVTNAAQWTISGGMAVLTNCNVIAGGALNLLGGTLIANQVNAPSAGGVVNFNGGLLTVGPGSTLATNFMPANLTGYIYAGGATIDSGTGLVSIAATLKAPTGYGLSSIAVTDGGSGYKGVPLVQISGGSGTGATAVALVDPVAGTVTNIFITNPGVGYLAADVLSVSLISGGYISQATLGTVSLIANSTSGGLTKLGSGILTLAGSNTYAGGTFLNAGELNITNSWNIGGPGSALTFNGGLLQIGSNYPVTLLDNHVVNWSSFTGGFDVLGSFAFALTNAITGGGSFTKLGSGTLTLTATNSYSGPTIVGGSGVFAFNTLSNLGGAVAAIVITNGTPTIAPTFVPASTFVGNTVIQPTTNIFIFALPASTSTNYNMASYAKGFLGATNGVVVDYTGVLAGPTNAVNLGGGGGTLLFNSQQIGGTRNFVGGDTNLFIGALGGIPGTVVTTNNHFYLGGTFITPSNTLQVGDGGSSGSLGAGNIVNNGTLVANRSDTYLLTNSMSGSGVLVQNGSGTLVLANNVFGNSGGLIANAGTTIFSNSFVRGGLTLSNGSTVVIVGGSNEGLMGDYYQGGSTTQMPLSNTFTTLATQTPVLAFNGSPATNTFDFNTGGSGVGFPPPYNAGGSLAVSFQARWQGVFNAPTNGLYIFVNNSDDNTVIYIDGNQVLSASGSLDQPGYIQLTAGGHSIVIFYQQGGSGYALRESIVLPGGSQVRLPNSMMAPAFTIGSLAGDAGTTLALSNHVSIVQTNDAMFAGAITGAGAVIKNGNNTLLLTGTNTYTGGTFLQMGRLAIGEDANIGGSAAPLVFAGGILQVTGTTLTNLDTHPVNWSLFNGGFDISNAANVFTVTNAIAGANVSKFGSGTLALNGSLRNTNGMTLNAGVLQLNASNSYLGGTLINAGLLQLGNSFALGNPTNALSMPATNATLDLNGYNVTIGSLSGGPFALITDSNAVAGVTTLTISNSVPVATTFGGRINDGSVRDLALTLSGPVRLTLTNNNTFSGSVLVNAGPLAFGGGALILAGSGGRLSVATNIVLANGAALILTNTASLNNTDRLNFSADIFLNDATLQFMNDGGNGSFSESFSTLSLDGGANTLISRQSSNTGTNALYLFGGIVRQPGAVLDIIGTGIGTGMNNRIYVSPTPALVNGMLPWATVNQTNFATYNTSFGSLSNYTAYQTGAWDSWAGADNVRFNTGFSATTNTTINSLNLHLISANAVVDLGGSILTLNSGGLLFGGTNLVNGQFVGAGYGTVLTNGIITAGDGLSAAELFYFVSQSVVTNSVTITDNGPAGVVSLVKAGSGTLLLNLASTNNYSGGTFLDSGTLYIQTDANLGAAGSNISINAATLQVANNVDFAARQIWTRAASAAISVDPGSTLTATSLIYGVGGLIKSGLGTLVLGENNTYSGGTMISNGTLTVGYDTALGAAGSLLALSGGALQVTNTMTFDTRSLLLGGTGGVLNVDPNMMLMVSSVISGTGGLIKAGAGTLVLSNVNTYGGMLVSNLVQGTYIAGGTVVLGVDGALSTGVVVMAGGQLAAGGSSTVTNYINLAVKSIFDTTPGNLKLSGPIYSTNASGLIKDGSGTLTLGGYNTYAGGTIVSNGTLVLTNALLTSALTVTNGASVVVSSAGALAGLTGDYYFNSANVVSSNYVNTYAVFNSFLATNTPALIYSGVALGNTNFEFGGNAGSAAATVQYFPPPFNSGNTRSLVRWQGVLSAPTNGVYTFNMPSDDGSRLYLDGVLIASQNGSGTTNLVAGPHHILIAYDNGGGGSENIYINIAFPMGTYSNRLPNTLLTSAGVIGSLAGDTASTVTIADGTLMVVQTNNAEFAGTITGDGRLAKSGPGLLTLSGANTHTGGTFLAGGTLGISGDGNLGAAGAPLTFAGGILQITGTTLTNLDLGRPINWNWFNGGFDIADGNNLFTLTNTLSGVSPIVKNGVGTLVLAGSNNFSGGFSINAGTVRVDSAFAIGLPGRLDMNGGVLNLNGNNAYITGLFGPGGRITDDSAVAGVTTLNLSNIVASGVFGGQITNGVNGRQMALTLGGTGTMIFTNANSYTGPTILQGAMLSLSNLAGALSGSTGIVINSFAALQIFNTAGLNNGNRLSDGATIVMQGGTLVFTNDGSSAVFAESVSNLVLAAGSSTIIAGATNRTAGTSSTLSFSNLVRSAGATINFTGAGLGTSVLNRIVFNPTPIVSGLMTNGLIGPWAIVNGLGTNADWAAYDANLNSVSNYTGYALNMAESTWNSCVNVQLTANTTLTGNRTNYSMKIGVTGATTTHNLGGYTLTVEGGGIIAVSGGTALISGGNLTAGTPGVGGELHYYQFNSGAGPTNQILANIVDNSGGPVTFVKNGPNPLSLIYGTNTYSGGTIVNQGLLMVGYNGNMATNAGGYVSGLGSGTLTVQQGGIVQFAPGSSSTYYFTNAIALNGGAIANGAGGGGAIFHLTGPMTLNQPLSFFGTASNSTIVPYGFAGQDIFLDNVVSGSGGLRIAGGGNVGAVFLTTNNTYSGGTWVNNGYLFLGSPTNVSTTPTVTNTLGTGLLTASSVGAAYAMDQGFLDFINARASSPTGVVNLMFTGKGVATTVTNALSFAVEPNLAASYISIMPWRGNVTYNGLLTPALNTYRFNGQGGSAALIIGSLLTNASDGTPNNLLIGPNGTVVLTNNNIYTGWTYVTNGGSLQLGTNTATGSLGLGPVTNNGTVIFMLTNSVAYAFTNSVPFFGAGGIVKYNSNLVQLAAANTGYTGAITVNAGTLQAGTNFAFGNGGGVMTVNNVSLLDLNGYTTRVGGLAGAGTVSDSSAVGGYNMLVISNSSAQTFSGSIVDGLTTRLSLLKLGAGVQVLAGTNSYTGGTIIGGYGLSGPLRAVFGLGLPYVGNLTISNGSFETSCYFTNALGAGSGQVQLPYYTNNLNPGNLAAAGFSAYGTNIVVNLGNNGGTLVWGSTYFNPGYLLLGDTTANATLVLSNGLDLAGVQRNIYANGPNNFVVLAGGVTNSSTTVANLVKYGQGTLVLTGTNLFYGTFNLQSGGLYINNDANLGSTGLTLTLGANANQSPVTLRVTNNVVFNNRPVVINTNVTFLVDSASKLTISNIVSSGGGVTLTKSGLGTLLFTTNANTYALRTVIAQGALVVGTTNALGTTNNLVIGSGRIDLSSPAGAIGTTNALDQSFINWVAVRSWTNFGGGTNVQGAIALAANSANALNFLAPNATNNWTNTFFNKPLTNAFLGAADGTWTYSGALSPWTNSGLGIRIFGNAVGPNSGTNVFLLGGGNGVLDFASVIGAGTNVVIGPEGFTGGGVVQFTNYNLMDGRIAVVGGTLRAQTNIGLASTANLMLSNGVFEVMGGGWLTSTLSRAAGGLWLATNSFAGFSTFGGPLILDLNGGNGSLLTWGNSNFAPTTLILGTNTTDNLIKVQNALDLNGGTRTAVVLSTVLMAGNITNTIGTGVLQRLGSGTLILSNVTAAYALNLQMGQTILDNGGFAYVTNALRVGQNTGDVAALTIRGSALLNNTNSTIIGDNAGAIGILTLQDNATNLTKYLYVGNNGMGAVYQSGGVAQGVSGGAWYLCNSASAFGYYSLSGGILLPGGADFAVGGNGGFGQFDMTGGAITNGGWIQIGRTGIGVFNISGGTVTESTTGNAIIAGNSAGSVGIISIMGNASVNAAGRVAFAWSAGSTGIVNLVGGTLSTPVVNTNAVGYSLFNFNGGTLRATASTNRFMAGLSAAYVYGGGAVIDSGTNVIVIGQSLLAPAGGGVTNISVAYGGQGYIMPPRVQLIGGGGSNATAYAQIDPVTGSVTNIVVTNPGEGYTSAPYALLVGGVLTNTFSGFAAVATVPMLATNVGGGLTKLGAGALTLTGSNTYTGTTVVSNGLLALNGYYTGGGALIIGGAVTNVMSLNAGTGFFNNVTLAGNAVLTNSTGSLLALTGDLDNGSTNFALNNFAGTFRFQGGTARTQQVEVASAYAAPMSATNFLFGTFQIGDPLSGSNAFVQLVDNRNNTAGIGNELFAASNLIVALSGSALDWNNRSGFAYNLSNSGTMQWTNAGNPAGTVLRMDVVNTFTNQGTIVIGNGTALQFSNAFLNGPTWGILSLFNGGVLTNFAAGSVLTNAGTITGEGHVAPAVANNLGGSITATGGTLRLTAGLTSNAGGAVNEGLLAALGAGAELNVAQAFTNTGIIQLNNATATFTAPRVDNAGQILGNGAFNAVLNNAAAGVVSNDGTGGTLTFNSAVSNAGNMVAINNSGLAFGQTVNNGLNGLIGAANGGTVIFNAAVTNAAGGLLGMRNQGTLIFNAGLTNNGTLGFDTALNPSTAIITGTLLLGSSGTISMTHTNDTLVMRGDFVNGSMDTNGFNMRYGTMVFGGMSATVTNTFEVASTNKGAVFSGFVNNMALGTLNITNHIEFVNNINNGGGLGANEALYVDVLHLFNGATLKLSQLTIYVGLEFIYEDGAGTKVLTGGQGYTINQDNKDSLGLANVFLDSGGQIVFVPEPSTSALVGLGPAALAIWQRRRNSLRR